MPVIDRHDQAAAAWRKFAKDTRPALEAHNVKESLAKKLMHPVLHLLGVPLLRYPTAAVYEEYIKPLFDYTDSAKAVSHAEMDVTKRDRDKTTIRIHTVDVFIGGLHNGVTHQQLVLLCAIANVCVFGIDIAGDSKGGLAAFASLRVEAGEQESRLRATLHKLVLIDTDGMWVVSTPQQLTVLIKHCEMLALDEHARYQDTPHRAVTTHRGDDWHPSCAGAECVQLAAALNTQMLELLLNLGERAGDPELMPTHADVLDVRAGARRKTVERMHNKWLEVVAAAEPPRVIVCRSHAPGSVNYDTWEHCATIEMRSTHPTLDRHHGQRV